MRLALVSLGKKVDVFLALNEKPPTSFDFLPGFDELKYAGNFNNKADVFVMIDTPNDFRLGEAATKLKNQATDSIILDHHAEDTPCASHIFTDPDSASTTLLTWELIESLGAKKTQDIANCCLTGLITDTGSFQYQNTDVRAFRLATEMVECGANPSLISEKVFMRNSLAMYNLQCRVIDRIEFFENGRVATSVITAQDLKDFGASKNDCEAMINLLRAIDGTEIVAIFREDSGHVKVSLRSVGNWDVRAIAQKFGGGGHKGASGCVLNDNLVETKRKVVEAIASELSS